MAIYDLFLSRNSEAVTLDNYAPRAGKLFFDSETGKIRVADGTVGGTPLVAELPLATSDTVGGFKLGAGVTLNVDNQLIIDSAGLDFNFSNFVASEKPGEDSSISLWLESNTPDQDIVFGSNDNGTVTVLGEFNVYPIDGPLNLRDPVFEVLPDGQVFIRVTQDDPLYGAVEIIGNDALTPYPPGRTGGMLHITGQQSDGCRVYLDGNDSFVSLIGRRFNGSVEEPTGVLADEDIYRITATAYTSDGYPPSASGQIKFTASEDHTGTAQGSRIEFVTTPTGDATTSRERSVFIDSEGIAMDDGKSIRNAGSIKFDTTDEGHVGHTEGTLCWDVNDGTLNIHHEGGVLQQVGQELYAFVYNNSGVVIPNGSLVIMNGAAPFSGQVRPTVELFTSSPNGTAEQTIAVATQDIANGDTGRVTKWGKVRFIDTTGPGTETWAIGDILYSSTTGAGNLTNVRPSSPNVIAQVGTVLKVDNTSGEIFVNADFIRPKGFGVFTRLSDYQPAVANTSYAVPLTNTEIASGISIDIDNPSRIIVTQAGLYEVTWTMNWGTAGGDDDEDRHYAWIKKNGIDVANSLRIGSIDGETGSETNTKSRAIQLEENDYVQIGIAVSNTNVKLDYSPSTGFAPAAPALEITIKQFQP